MPGCTIAGTAATQFRATTCFVAVLFLLSTCRKLWPWSASVWATRRRCHLRRAPRVSEGARPRGRLACFPAPCLTTGAREKRPSSLGVCCAGLAACSRTRLGRGRPAIGCGPMPNLQSLLSHCQLPIAHCHERKKAQARARASFSREPQGCTRSTFGCGGSNECSSTSGSTRTCVVKTRGSCWPATS